MKKLSLLLILGFTYFTGTSQAIRLQENFNAASLPTGWTNIAVSGTQTWSFGNNGSATNTGNNNLDGTAMAFFDDDNLGIGNTNSTVRLTSPSFDNANDISSTLEFDYNFRELAGPADRFYVEVYDGTAWNTIFSTRANDCGNWLGACVGNFPHANIDITAHKNANCQVRFTYHDGNDWSWYVGLDNVRISSPFRNDIGVSRIINPTKDCGLSAETISVQINNYSAQAVSIPFGITLDVNSGTQVVNEVINTAIPANDSIVHVFNSTVNLTALSNHTILAFTNYTLDSNMINNGITSIITNGPIEQLPYFENFQNQHFWSIGGVNSSWQNGIPNGNRLKNKHNIDNSFITNISGLYNNNEKSFIESPCIDLRSSSTPMISFDLNYQIERNFDSLFFEYSINRGVSWQMIPRDSVSSNWPATGSFWTGNSNDWIHLENRMSQLANNNSIRFRFRLSTDGGTAQEGVAIDNFTIKHKDSNDLKLMEILPPNSIDLCSNGNQNILIKLKNKGLNALDSFTVSYQVNSGIVFTESVNQLLLPEQELVYATQSSYNFLNGINSVLDVWINHVNDAYNANDSLFGYVVDTLNFNSISTSYSTPFYEDFNGPSWSVNSIGVDWELEKSSQLSSDWSVGNSSNNSCPTSDPEGLSSGYIYNSFFRNPPYLPTSILSPCISLDLNKNSTLEFYYFSLSSPHFNLKVDLYNGNTWNTIDTITSAPQTSCNSIWSRFQKDLSAYGGKTIKIKLTHSPNTPLISSEIIVDNFQIFEKLQTDVKLIELGNHVSDCSPKDTISVLVENLGILSIPAIPIAFQVNGGPIITDTIINNLASYDTVRFKKHYSFATQNTTYNIKVWLNLLADQNNLNDTIEISLRNTKRVSDYFEDFESFTDQRCISYNYLDNIGDWKRPPLFTGLNFNWQLHDVSLCGNGTPALNTGPYYDHTLGNGKFMYYEFYNSGNNAQLITPCLDFSQDSSVELSFWYHKYGSQMQDLFIDVFANGIWHMDVDSIIGQTHFSYTDPWLKKVVGLNQFAGEIIEISFRSSTNNSSLSDMAIDDVHIYNPLIVGAVEEMIQPSIQLYPNPNNGNFNLNVSNELVGKQYHVFDVKGGLVKQARIDNTNSQIELSNAEKGVYFIRIEGYAKAERIVVL